MDMTLYIEWAKANPEVIVAVAVYLIVNFVPRKHPEQSKGIWKLLWLLLDRASVLTHDSLPGKWKWIFQASPLPDTEKKSQEDEVDVDDDGLDESLVEYNYWNDTYNSWAATAGYDDILYNDGFGVFDGVGIGAGVAAHDAVITSVTEEGVAFEFVCEGCGHARLLTLDYAEVIALQHGLSPDVAFGQHPQHCADPTQWVYRTSPDNAWCLLMGCNNAWCRANYPLRLSSDEPRQYLASAMNAGYLNRPGVKTVQVYCQRLKNADAGQPVLVESVVSLVRAVYQVARISVARWRSRDIRIAAQQGEESR